MRIQMSDSTPPTPQNFDSYQSSGADTYQTDIDGGRPVLGPDHDEVFSEAEEVGYEEDLGDEIDEDEGEDLFNENLERDYVAQPELDRYDPTLLDDDTSHDGISAGARRRAEREIEERERARRDRAGRRTAASRYYTELEDLLADGGEEDEEGEARRRRRREAFRETTLSACRPLPRQAAEAREQLPPCDIKSEWSNRIEEIITLVFQGFIWHYKKPVQEGNHSHGTSDLGMYIDKITALVRDEATSLTVNWNDLSDYSVKLSDWITLKPLYCLKLLDAVTTEIICSMFPKLYEGIQITVRVTGYLGFEELRALRTDCLNQLVAVEGVCIRRTNILPQMKIYYLECQKCGCDLNGPYEKKANLMNQAIKRRCQDCQSFGPFTSSREKTIYENYQLLTIQESPGNVKAGQIPRQRKVTLLGDIVDRVRPGDEVVVTGIFQIQPTMTLNAKTGFPIFETMILANNIQRKGDLKMEELTEQDVEKIKKLSRHKLIREKIIASIAPSIWGHRHLKSAIAYSMFGGVPRSTQTGHQVRADINVLCLGDPGMGKSQFLKYVEKTYERTVFTTGKGASAVGLTAAVKRDPTSGEWTLEGGALVLADEGICLIDEFDKMSDKDRVSIHEAMEQQSISISKAGLVATLRARCAVIAAANPIFGRYDHSLTFAENVDLSDALLSRFDLLSVLKDEVNPIHDEYLADYVVTSHMRSHPNADILIRQDITRSKRSRGAMVGPSGIPNDDDIDDWMVNNGPIPHELLKKYIFYARRSCFPEIRSVDQSKLSDFYGDIRQAALNSGGLPMTVRHFESIMRIATANAKMRLSSFVEKRDFDFAMASILESFIQSQKFAVAMNLNKRFGRYRALAASPNEFIETLLSDILSRKGRRRFRSSQRRGHHPPVVDMVGAEDCTESALQFADAEATVNELNTLALHMYNLPESAVQQYLQTAMFRSKFQLRRDDHDWVISQIRAEFDASSQGSQESQS